jgi:putative transposase
MSDSRVSGQRFRTFNAVDEGARETLALEVDPSLPSERVIRVLE